MSYSIVSIIITRLIFSGLSTPQFFLNLPMIRLLGVFTIFWGITVFDWGRKVMVGWIYQEAQKNMGLRYLKIYGIFLIGAASNKVYFLLFYITKNI